jgi:hypothetical protein
MTILKCSTVILSVIVFLAAVTPAWSDDQQWEYQVVIVKGITAGGAIKKQSSRIFLDEGKTEALATLAADDWEVLSVVGTTGADDTVYLRRPLR